MHRRTRRRVILVSMVTAVTLTGTAAGYVTGRVFTVRQGDAANFPGKRSVWTCNNLGRYVSCQGGDAFPYVKLGGGFWPCGCVTVKVYTLRDPQGGHVIRTYEHGYPVYIFRAI